MNLQIEIEKVYTSEQKFIHLTLGDSEERIQPQRAELWPTELQANTKVLLQADKFAISC